MSIVLIQRRTSTNNIEKVLGVYSTWRRAWLAFHEKWKKGGYPYTGGIFRHNNVDLFEYMTGELKSGTTSVLIFANDNITVYADVFAEDAVIR